MKHFIFTSILPDDGEQHTNVDTDMEMENIWKSFYTLGIIRISGPRLRTRSHFGETLISNSLMII